MRKARVHTLLRYVAANVQSLRAARGLTQLELAERAELDLRHLQRIERANVNLSIGALLALADSLGVPPSSLFEPADLAPPRVGRPRHELETPEIVERSGARRIIPPERPAAAARPGRTKAVAKERVVPVPHPVPPVAVVAAPSPRSAAAPARPRKLRTPRRPRS